MLRNFPHQINHLPKIHGALACIVQLLEQDKDPLDDGSLGYACARQGIYTFRQLPSPSPADLERRIRQEQRKPRSDQGPQTFARDLRRTLILMGLIRAQRSTCSITPVGERLLQFPAGSADAEYRQLWRDAILRITLPSTDRHPKPLQPAPIILRLADAFPDNDKRWLALSLEARDDSDREYQRIARLVRDNDWEASLRTVGANAFKAANAVKILPSLLEQVGLLQITQGACRLTADGRQLLGRAPRAVPAAPTPPARRPRRRRARPLPANVQRPGDIPVPPPARRQAPTQEAMQQALDLLGRRTGEHQDLLRRLVESLRNVKDRSATSDRYDLYVNSTIRREVILFEVKTGENLLLQGRLALGQLCQYEHFDIRPNVQAGRRILKVAVFGAEPGQQVRDFLQAYGVFVVVSAAGAFIVPPELSDYFPHSSG